MTITEINNLSINRYWEELTYRLLPSLTPDKMQMQGNTYADIMLNISFTKPPLTDYEAEFLLLKQELVIIEEARLAEVARRKALQDRIDLLDDLNVLAYNIGRHQPNMLVAMRDLINNNDTVFLDDLEAEMILHKAKMAKNKAIQDKKDIGYKQKLACEECLSIIRGDNVNKTDAEINAMLITFADVYSALTQNRPILSRTLITSVVNDGIIDTLKQELLDELTEHGF